MGMFGSVEGHSQASYTATKNALPPFSVFGGASSVYADYGQDRQNGYFLGGAYTHNFSHIYVVPSLELRASITPMGDHSVAERTFQGGFKLEHAYFRRFHPYGEALFGTGTIRYRAGLQGVGEKSDNSVVPSFGGGIDVDIIKDFGVKADYMSSHWNTGGSVTYTPNAFNYGVYYRLPFGHR